MTARGMAAWRAVALACLLSGCGSDQSATETVASLRTAGLGIVGAVFAPATTAPVGPVVMPQVERSVIDASPTPLRFVALEKTGGSAVTSELGRSGAVRVFATANELTFALRDGVLVGTRGLGPDLMSADAPTAAALRTGNGGHRRVHDYLTGTNATRRVALTCAVTAMGNETLSLAGLSVPTQVVAETCSSGAIVAENRYWFDTSGRIRQSRQWAGEDAGYVQIMDPMR